MAYNSGTKYSGSANRGATAATAATATKAAGKVENIYQTGLWAKEGAKSLCSVQVKEDVTIPAGSYINIFANAAEDKKSETSPDFKLTVRPGVLKTK
jgi:hypothetical protein